MGSYGVRSGCDHGAVDDHRSGVHRPRLDLPADGPAGHSECVRRLVGGVIDGVVGEYRRSVWTAEAARGRWTPTACVYRYGVYMASEYAALVTTAPASSANPSVATPSSSPLARIDARRTRGTRRFGRSDIGYRTEPTAPLVTAGSPG